MEDTKPKAKVVKKDSGDEKKVEAVISGTAKVQKKSGARKFMDNFISEDAQSVKSYIIGDVLIPTAKKLFVDIVKDSIEMFVYGSSSQRGRSGSSNRRTDYVSYNRYSDRDRRDDRYSSRTRNAFSYDNIIYDTYGDAQAVIDEMLDTLDRYGVVTVADVFEASRLPAPYTANKYGWTNIRNSGIRRVRDGYVIDLPRALEVD